MRTVVVRNGDWWGRNWPHNVDRVEYVHMTDDAELAQALIGGRIDFLPTCHLTSSSAYAKRQASRC